jgi:hypothetical protein
MKFSLKQEYNYGPKSIIFEINHSLFLFEDLNEYHEQDGGK